MASNVYFALRSSHTKFFNNLYDITIVLLVWFLSWPVIKAMIDLELCYCILKGSKLSTIYTGFIGGDTHMCIPFGK